MPFFFTVCPVQGGDESQAQLEIVRDEKSLAQLPLMLPVPDAAGLIQFRGALPTAGIPPGTYDLRVTVQDGQHKISHLARLNPTDLATKPSINLAPLVALPFCVLPKMTGPK